jgi:hypothetical protein
MPANDGHDIDPKERNPMSSRTILTDSSILLFAAGGLAGFAADEVAGSLGLEISFVTRMFAEFAGIGVLVLAT